MYFGDIDISQDIVYKFIKRISVNLRISKKVWRSSERPVPFLTVLTLKQILIWYPNSTFHGTLFGAALPILISKLRNHALLPTLTKISP
jgi:hypothetical protein